MSPPDSASVQGSGTYEHGQTVILLPIPNEGYRFSHWSGEGLPSNHSANPTLTVDRSFDLVAIFERDFSEGIITASLNAKDIGSLWYESPWFGSFHKTSSRWLYHLSFGWIFSPNWDAVDEDSGRRYRSIHLDGGFCFWFADSPDRSGPSPTLGLKEEERREKTPVGWGRSGLSAKRGRSTPLCGQ